MNLAASASFRAAGAGGDVDDEPYDDREFCGKDSAFLLGLGFNFDLCSREPGHAGFCWFLALPPMSRGATSADAA